MAHADPPDLNLRPPSGSTSARALGRSVFPANRRGLGHPWLTLAVAALALVMFGVDATIVSVANPTIGHRFHASLSDLQWVTNAYLLALAVTLIFGGKLGDLLGRKRVFMIGTAGFALASLAAGLSASLDELIAFRAVQGLFGAMMVPQTLAILRATFPIEKLAAALGLWTMTASIGIASGPIVGGVLINHTSWRWIFIINVPLGVLSLVVASWVVRESRDQAEGRRFDPPGIALLSGFLFTLVWGLIEAERNGWGHFTPFAWLIAAALLLVLFVAWEIREERVRHPHIPLSLFRSPQFSAGVLMAFSSYIGFYSVLFFVSLYLQRVHGYSATQTGVRFLTLTAVMGVSAFLGSRIVAKFGPPLPLLIGGLLYTAGLVGFSRLGPDTSFSSVWPFLTLVGLGFGPTQTGYSRAIVGGAPPRYAGIAGGLQTTVIQVGGLLGLSVLGSVIVSRVSSTLPERLAAAGVQPRLLHQLSGTAHSVAQGLVPSPRGIPIATSHAITRGDHLAFTTGLDTAMAIAAAIVGAATVIAFIACEVSARRTRTPLPAASEVNDDSKPDAAAGQLASAA